jgi:hypothetical protein
MELHKNHVPSLVYVFDFIELYLNILQLDDRFFSLSRVPPGSNVAVDESFLALREDLIFVIQEPDDRRLPLFVLISISPDPMFEVVPGCNSSEGRSDPAAVASTIVAESPSFSPAPPSSQNFKHVDASSSSSSLRMEQSKTK